MLHNFGHRRIAAPVALLALALGLAGCGGDDGGGESAVPQPGTFVGEVRGSDMAIALVTDGQKVGGYFCDNRDFSAWLVESEISDGKARLTNRKGKEVGEVSFGDAEVSGEITVPGARGSFTAKPATDDAGHAGLYRGLPARGKATQELGVIAFPAREQAATTITGRRLLASATGAVQLVRRKTTIGWIILPDGSQEGTVVRLSGPLPDAAITQPFISGVRYPAVVKFLGADDLEHGGRPDPEGQPNVELLAGTRFRVTRLEPDDLGQ